ncbi:MAG: hypothetical protein HXS46_15505 [Theionarchaea archaeon]|nr:hypothetical protein [Theionarchaea archaeon]
MDYPFFHLSRFASPITRYTNPSPKKTMPIGFSVAMKTTPRGTIQFRKIGPVTGKLLDDLAILKDCHECAQALVISSESHQHATGIPVSPNPYQKQ